MGEVVPNVGADPINPPYYDGTACAEIIEHLPANVAFAAKYGWRLGEKDEIKQEAGKAIWYIERELKRGSLRLTGEWFLDYAMTRIEHRFAHGKLDMVRSEILGRCVIYAVTGEVSNLERAIELYQTYL